MERKRELFDMRIEEISVVDDPANEGARVVIVKSKGGAAAHEQENEQMDMNEVAAALREAERTVAESTEAMKIEKARADAAEAKAADLEAKIAKSQPVDPAAEEAEVMKSLPEAIRKRLIEAETELAKSREASELADAITKARSLGAAEDEAREIGPLLMRVRKGKSTAEDAGKLEQIIKSAKAVLGSSGVFARIGSGADSGSDSPDAFFKAKAAEIRKAKPEMTEAEAYAKAVEANPDVYARMPTRNVA